MKFGLYPRLALAGIRKNKRLYIPYLLTCTGMAMMYYIIIFLQHNEMLDGMRGGTTASTILALGGWVVAAYLFFVVCRCGVRSCTFLYAVVWWCGVVVAPYLFFSSSLGGGVCTRFRLSLSVVCRWFYLWF